MLLSLQTAPSATPVTLAEAKAHLRVEHDEENTLITQLLNVAVAEMEGRHGSTRRAFMPQTWDYYLPYFPSCRDIELPMPPLRTVAFVKYFDQANAEQTLSADAYEVVAESFIGRITLTPLGSWPATYDREKAVNIRFQAGYADAASVPANVKQAILLRVGELYAGRGDEIGDDAAPAIKRLLGPSYVVRLR